MNPNCVTNSSRNWVCHLLMSGRCCRTTVIQINRSQALFGYTAMQREPRISLPGSHSAQGPEGSSRASWSVRVLGFSTTSFRDTSRTIWRRTILCRPVTVGSPTARSSLAPNQTPGQTCSIALPLRRRRSKRVHFWGVVVNVLLNITFILPKTKAPVYLKWNL